MKKYIIILILCAISNAIHAQDIQDPIKYMAKPGTAMYIWKLDINRDGVRDLLIGYEASASDTNSAKENLGELYNENIVGFDCFIGLKKGGYIKCKYVDTGKIKMKDVPITIDIDQCYVGYIDEIKKYGIVSVSESEVAPPSHHGLGVLKEQLYCYTVEGGDHLKLTNLTPLYDSGSKNSIYEKYLSKAKRTKIQLQEVNP